MKINLRAMMLASGLMISMIPFMPGEASAEKVSVPDSRKLSDITYMQDMNPYICENSAENESKQLIDTRDGKSYWVTKLRDGNCWMTQNLALDLDIAKPLTSTDSDVSSSYTPTANTQQGTITKFPSSSDRTLSYNPGEYVYTTPTEQHSCGSSGITKLEGCPNWTLVTGLSKDTSGNTQAHYLAGNYYSYEVATAGYTSNSGSAPSSICPKGWQLPENQASTAGTTVVKSYRNLFDNYGWSWNSGSDPNKSSNSLTGTKDGITYDIRSNPLHFVYGGYIAGSSLDYAGSYGYYWSSTAASSTNAYNLNLYSGVIPSSNGNRYIGVSVRCVTRPKESKKTLSDLTYMQEMTTGVCEKSAENETKQLIDQRDGKTYWVAKLKDGNCWMTQNLDLDLYVNGVNRKLTSADSDVTNDWTSTTGASGLWNGISSDYNVVKYYDPGEYAYTNPTNRLSSGCGLLNSDTCKNAGWELMSGASSDKSGNEMAHYLVGNYYSWGAATAGQAASISGSGESTQSICPTGWRLPINSDNKSYTNLFAAYGTLSGLYAGTQDIRLSPLYFVYGGFVGSSSLSVSGAGSYGRCWSSTAIDSYSAYDLYFDTGVYPSYNDYRYLGMSVRCVSRADVPDNNDNVTITITPTLSLDVAATTEIPYTAGGVSIGNLSATVKSNQQHAIKLSATEPKLVNEADSNKFIPASTNVSAGTSAWGIKKKQSAASTPLGSTTDVSAYTALTSTPDIFYRSAAGSEGAAPINFSVGISTDSSIASGTYSTNVTVTATTI